MSTALIPNEEDARREAAKVVIRKEVLICVHDPEALVHLREENACYLIIRWMRDGTIKESQISKEEAMEWLNANGHNPNNYSVPVGSIIHAWY